MKSKTKAKKPDLMTGNRSHRRRLASSVRPGARIPKMEPEHRPGQLNVVTEDSLLEMRAGDVIFLDESVSMRSMVESDFSAVLSCPGCGTLGLITIPKFNGIQPVICGADDCSCRFQIVRKAQFEFLAAS